MPAARVDWTSYSAVYDVMATANPAYHELLDIVTRTVTQWPLPHGAHLLDVGAGTGNFSLRLAKCLPHISVTHLDNDDGMIALAKTKASAINLCNIHFLRQAAGHVDFAPYSLDAAISIHALYALPDPTGFLCKLHGWLKPSAPVLFCDLGRHLRLGDWAWFLFQSMRRDIGVRGAVGQFVRGRQVAYHNRLIASKQRNREYWTHSPKDFRAAVESAGFHVHSQKVCYRGYSDLIVGCAAPPAAPSQSRQDTDHSDA
jgi:ubiquinone/menaquinone biosynthesis C-methylase UbiE